MLAAYILSLALSVFLLATSVVGIQCYDSAKKPDDKSKRFLVVSIIIGIFSIFASGFGIYLSNSI